VDNPWLLGEDTIDNIAHHIFTSKGPSGENIEYLLELVKAIRKMGVYDQHLFDLEVKVLELMTKQITNGN